jgi:transposase
LFGEDDVENAAAAGVAIQKKSSRAAEQDRPDIAQQRLAWQSSQPSVDPERLVFVDETGLKTDISRLRGWAAGGARLVEATPGGHWRTSTLVQAVALDGTRAAMVLDGPLNSLCFAGFCQHFLAPALQPGDLVVLDNLSSHKSSAATAAIEAAGARLIYLPPYSPDLNPIENLFSKIKQLIRRFRPSNWRQIVRATKHALLAINYDDIANTFLHCGYGAT